MPRPEKTEGNAGFYDPVGVCVYCKRRPPEVPQLTQEHILALSLGGYPFLDEASCGECAGKINKFERVMTEEILKAARTHLKIRTRRPRERPTELPTTIGNVEVLKHPLWVILQDFNHPRILGLSKRISEEPGHFTIRMHSAPETGVRTKDLGPDAGIPFIINPDAVLRTMAKTAYCYAVAELGLSAFTSRLPEMLIERKVDPRYLVGAIPGANSKGKSGRDTMPPLFHTVELKQARNDTGRLFLTCEIALFRSLTMPIYQVVIGSLTKASNSLDVISSFTQHL